MKLQRSALRSRKELSSTVLILVLLVLSLSFSSAEWFSDSENIITGKAITGNVIDSYECLRFDASELYCGTHSTCRYHEIGGNGHCGSKAALVSAVGVDISNVKSIDVISLRCGDPYRDPPRIVTCPAGASYDVCVEYNVDYTGNYVLLGVKYGCTEIGLLVHYLFDGNVNDSSGSKRDGTVVGNVRCETTGVIGKACDFDGNYSSVNVPLNPSAGYTVSGWVQMGEDKNMDFWGDESSERGSGSQVLDGNLYTISSGSRGYYRYKTNATLVPNNWYHIVVIYGSNTQTYVNGALVGTDSVYLTKGQITFRIGQSSDGSFHAGSFSGSMDDFRIYNRVLSLSEIKELYSLGSGNGTTPKVTCNWCSSCGKGLLNVCDRNECMNNCGSNDPSTCYFVPSSIGGNCFAKPTIEVNSCGYFNQPGKYVLQKDIYLDGTAASQGYCFIVSGKDIVLDLNGNNIYGYGTFVNISVSSPIVMSGERVILTWYPLNMTSCTASGGSTGWAGDKNASDGIYTWSSDILTIGTYVYNISCISGAQVFSKAVTVYVPNVSTVIFDSQNATVVANPATKTVVSPAITVVTLPTTPTKAGYVFGGWYTEIGGEGTQFTATIPVTANITLYAKWGFCSGGATDSDCWSAVAPTLLAWGPEPFADYYSAVTNVRSTTDGAANTAALAGLEGSYPAAHYCDQLSEGGFTDWYLPAFEQLLAASGVVSGFPNDYYWSSTESSDYPEDGAWYVGIYTGGTAEENYKAWAYSVRCLRSGSTALTNISAGSTDIAIAGNATPSNNTPSNNTPSNNTSSNNANNNIGGIFVLGESIEIKDSNKSGIIEGFESAVDIYIEGSNMILKNLKLSDLVVYSALNGLNNMSLKLEEVEFLNNLNKSGFVAYSRDKKPLVKVINSKFSDNGLFLVENTNVFMDLSSFRMLSPNVSFINSDFSLWTNFIGKRISLTLDNFNFDYGSIERNNSFSNAISLSYSPMYGIHSTADVLNFPELDRPYLLTNEYMNKNLFPISIRPYYDYMAKSGMIIVPNNVVFLSGFKVDPFFNIVMNGFHFCKVDSDCYNGRTCLNYKCVE